MVVFGISTLQGTIIQVDCEPSSVVRDFKQQCIDESDFDLTPLGVNVDLAGLMTVAGLTKWEGVRVATLHGELLDDDRSIGSQMIFDENLFLCKLVFMKQGMAHLTPSERTQIAHFADPARFCAGYYMNLLPHGTPFVVLPVWGGVDRANEILGVLYQHKTTAEHCRMMQQGVDPRIVDVNVPIFQVELQK